MTLSRFDTFHAVQRGFYVTRDDFQKPDNEIVKAAGEAIVTCSATLKQLEEFQRTQKEDYPVTEGRQKMRVAEFARKQLASHSNALLTAQAKVAKQLGELEERRQRAYKPNDAASETRFAAIRTELTNMPRNQRDEKIRTALNSGDVDLIASIATGGQNNAVCTGYHYGECRKAYDKLNLGDDYQLMQDLILADQLLTRATVNFDADMTSEFIAPGLAVEEAAGKAAADFYGE